MNYRYQKINFRYSIDTKLKVILNNSKLFSDENLSANATVRDILAHRMGLTEYNNMRLDSDLTRTNLIK